MPAAHIYGFVLGGRSVGSWLPAFLQSPINAGAFCMIAGLVIVPVVSAFTKRPDEKLVSETFSCYERKVLVEQKEALGDREEL